MKRFLISASLVLLTALAFTSCKKCQTCTTKTDITVLGITTNTSVPKEYCGKEYDDAPAEISTSVTVQGITTAVDITCEKS